MTSLQRRLARLAQYYRLRKEAQAVPPKRAVPDWLQASLESQGLVFASGGQVVSSPDRPAGPPPVVEMQND